MKINIFSLIIFIFLSLYSNAFSDMTEVEISNTNELKCTYKIESDHDILNSKIDCRNFTNKKYFIEGWDRANCKLENFSIKKENSIYKKVAIYCLSLDEKKYIQVY